MPTCCASVSTERWGSERGPGVPRPLPAARAITTVHHYPLPLDREAGLGAISQVSSYRDWWPWLRSFEGPGLAEGEDWRCEVQPPVPYPVRFRVAIEHVEAPPGCTPGCTVTWWAMPC